MLKIELEKDVYENEYKDFNKLLNFSKKKLKKENIVLISRTINNNKYIFKFREWE